jgi:hypothetical protein
MVGPTPDFKLLAIAPDPFRHQGPALVESGTGFGHGHEDRAIGAELGARRMPAEAD